jgi:signal transduction histidine kinase/ligand-binding sensor domain-containing protein
MDFKKLSSQPFYLEGFNPLKRPMEESRFDIDNLPDTTINFENIPAKHLLVKTSIIQPPVVIKAGLPRLKKNAATGIFEFGEDQGLPGAFISTLMQDSHGMMWIMTDKGLCRFNGEHLEIYSFIETIFTGELASASKIIEDKQGRIWIKTDISGVYIFDPKAGVVSHIDLPIDVVQLKNDNAMILDSRGLIWICTSTAGLYIIDPRKQTLRNIPNLRAIDNGYIEQILEDNERNIWAGSFSGLAIIDYKSGKIRFASKANGLLSDTISGMFMDTEKRIWIGSPHGVSIVNSTGNTINRLGQVQGVDRSISHFTEDYKGRVWMASDSGVYVFESAAQRLRHITSATGLTDNKIRTIVKDDKEQVWIDTYAGINLIDLKGIMPDYYTENNGLAGTDIWSFLDDGKKRMWIGSRSGVDIYSPATHSIMHLGKDVLLKKWPTISYLIRQSPDGKIVIAAPNSGIEIIDTATNRITFFTKEQGLKNLGMPTFMTDDSGRVWTGSFGRGIEIYDPGKKSSVLINNKNGLIGNIVWELMQDKKGYVWAGTDSGINIINLKDRTIRYLKDGGNISKENTSSFVTDDEGKLWIGTRSRIYIADEENNLLTTITTTNGLAAPDVYTLFKYRDQVYAGTGNGLTVFTPKEKKPPSHGKQFEWRIHSYDKNQGFLYNNYNSGAVEVADDKLWWGIEDKALTITDIPRTDSGVSSTLISGIIIADKLQNFADNKWVQHSLAGNDTIWSIKKDTFYLRDKLPSDTNWLYINKISWDSLSGYFNLPVNLSLPYKQNYISFQFTGSQLSNRNKTRYRYILEGVDKNWSAITSNPFSENYRDIPAGKYTFKVSSKGANGVWSEPAEFSFTILPPWWNTWWAYLLYLAVFSLIVWVIVQYRSRQLKQENLHLEEMVAQRTKELSQSIKDLKNTQSQLVQSEKMASLGELTAGIAHEIQNPLNFVNNFSEVNKELIEELKEERKKEQRDARSEEEILKDLEQNLEKIAHHGKRADAIVKGMLQHSRASTGQKEPTDINALADEYLRLAYHGLRAKEKSFNATFKTDFDKSIGKVYVVPQDMGRVFLNLINNAFYAASLPSKGGFSDSEKSKTPTVEVSTKKEGNKVIISVKDNGNGIPQNLVDKIFQPFFTTKPTGQGTGLGLSLSYDIVTKGHNGELKVQSREGEGAEFIISLPLK